MTHEIFSDLLRFKLLFCAPESACGAASLLESVSLPEADPSSSRRLLVILDGCWSADILNEEEKCGCVRVNIVRAPGSFDHSQIELYFAELLGSMFKSECFPDHPKTKLGTTGAATRKSR